MSSGADELDMVFTTNPGIEDIVVEEINAKLGARVVEERRGKGRVIARIPRESLDLIDSLRSIHRARILLYRGKICGQTRCLEEIMRAISRLDVHRYITPEYSFAIRAERVGDHEFNSLDVARKAGDAVIKAVSELYGLRPPVDLDYPSIILSVDVIHDELYVAVELGGDLSWHRRGYRVYDHPAALKPTLAYAMLRLSGAQDGDIILDPMCGGGTIAIEAAYLFENSRIICMDKNPKHIEGAKMNAKAALVYPRIDFIVGDATRLKEYVAEVDVVVSNPPYGIRMGSPREVRRVYKRFLDEVTSIARKSITLITTEHVVVKQVLSAKRWSIAEDRIVAHGGLHPHIIVGVKEKSYSS